MRVISRSHLLLESNAGPYARLTRTSINAPPRPPPIYLLSRAYTAALVAVINDAEHFDPFFGNACVACAQQLLEVQVRGVGRVIVGFFSLRRRAALRCVVLVCAELSCAVFITVMCHDMLCCAVLRFLFSLFYHILQGAVFWFDSQLLGILLPYALQ